MCNKLSSCILVILTCINLHLHNNGSLCMLCSVIRYVKIFCKDANYDNLPQNKLAEAIMLLTL
jgi:hypothetical protein